MRITILLLLALAVVVAQGCTGPHNPSCSGGKDDGRGGSGCHATDMWWYSQRDRKCHKMRYHGCGGNNNRYCSRSACERRCT